ncbi:SET and MYND domain-containing protein 4-like [Copidosoma floridanum]|uniref:SET and MYND domain-containing protein 4-like n=1 Tax=Copidosoma floridanum TaxID=29053 RepID=UPI0006C9B1EA|nr:SET and MYND domain-containing protein 4-like [Copidosoma floridanum]
MDRDDGLDDERRLIVSMMGQTGISGSIVPTLGGEDRKAKNPRRVGEYLQRSRNPTDNVDSTQNLKCTARQELMLLRNGRIDESSTADNDNPNLANHRYSPRRRNIDLSQWMSDLETAEAEQLNQKHILKSRAAVDSPFTSRALKLCEGDDKYGRHVRAIRNISPGEVVAVERSALTFVCPHRTYVYCSHCLKACWAARDCDYCIHSVYCSSTCKRQAWLEYHSYECLVQARLRTNDEDLCCLTGLTFVKAVLAIVHRVGGIDKLRNSVAHLRSSGGVDCSVTYGLDEIYNLDVGGIYCRKAREFSDYPEHEVTTWTLFACRVAYLLVKETLFFGESRRGASDSLRMIVEDQDVLFVTALVLRSFLVFPFKHFYIYGYSENCDKTDHLGTGVYQFCSNMNHSCNPNAEYFVTEDNELVVFARQKIQKDSQIFIAYRNCKFTMAPRIERIRELEKFYSFTCTCEACINDWSTDTLVSFEDLTCKSKDYNKEKFNNFIHKLQSNLLCYGYNDGLKYLKETRKFFNFMAIQKIPVLSVPHYCLVQYIFMIFVKLFGHKLTSKL